MNLKTNKVMKNIHVLPTGKISRLFVHDGKLGLAKGFQYGSDAIQNQNIFITSDEEIKGGDWCLDLMNNTIYVATKVVVHNLKSLEYEQYLKKIILTTDKDLINDGVQPIDDEFLEWFVKNPSCESVGVEKVSINCSCAYQSEHRKNANIIKENTTCHIRNRCDVSYKIIIPKEEPKQETLKETKLRQLFKNRSNCYADTGRFENDGSYSEGEVIQAMDEDCFINVIKEWQAERMYSEEDLREAFKGGGKMSWTDISQETQEPYYYDFNEWFEQFKKK